MFQPLTRYYQKHKTRIHRLSAEGIWVVVGQVASVIGALVLVRVLTEYLAPAHYGQLALGLTIASFVSQVVLGGIAAGVGRYYSIAVEKQDLGGYLYATRFLLGCATAAMVVIGLILIVSLYWLGYSHWIGLAAAVLLFALFSGYSSILSGIQSAARQRIVVAFHSGLDSWLKVLLTVGVVVWLGTSSDIVVLGYATSTLMITLSQLVFLRCSIPEQRKRIRSNDWWAKEIWEYSLPFIVFAPFTWLHLASDRWALQSFATLNEVGQYAVLYQLGYTPIALVTGMVINFIGPIMYQRAGDASSKDRNSAIDQLSWRMVYISLSVTIFCFLTTLVFHDYIFLLLVNSEYRKYSHLLQWLVLAGGIFASGQLLALKLMSEMRHSVTVPVKIITAVMGIMLNFYGATYFGIQGVIAANLAFSFAYFILMIVLVKYIL